MDSLYFNIGNQLEKIADNIPKVPAIIMLRNKVKQTGFLELHRETNRLASGLAQSGVSQGHRVLLMVHPSLEFIALTYALFRIGAVPILIDPGLSRKSILGCVKAAEPDGMIAIPLAHAARILLSKPFETIQTFITVGKRWFWGGKTLAQIKAIGNEDF